MSALQNRQFKLIARPVGMVKRTDFDFSTVPVPEPALGEVLVKVQYISLDPAMRGWMNDRKSYIAPVGLGEVMRAGGVGTPGRHPGPTQTHESQGNTRSGRRHRAPPTREQMRQPGTPRSTAGVYWIARGSMT